MSSTHPIIRIWHGWTTLVNADAYDGDDYRVAVVPPKAWALLTHFDEHSHHYEEIIN
jgi:hypothetical protein